MNKLWLSISFLLLIFAGASCKSQLEQALKSKDVNYRFSAANKYYEKHQWYKANQLYETLLPAFRGTKNYEELYWRYASSFYEMKDYMSASYQFKNFTETFSKSERAEEAYFLYAVSLYKMSYKWSLDQTSTQKALEVLQTYINMYPDSKKLSEANNYIQEGRVKLEKKAAEAAQLYYNIGYYNAASTSYKTLIFDYPESTSGDYYDYMLARSYYFYAKNSRADKQEERYADVLSAYNDMKSNYPNSSYLKDAKHYSELSQNTINKLRNEHQ